MRNNYKFPFVGLLLIGFLLGQTLSNSERALVWLKNDNIEVGILAEVGGRVVVLRQPSGPNMFKSNSTQWANAELRKPKITASSDFVPYNGHIVWLGPQKYWWTQQNVNQKRRDQKTVWPPDPYLIYGKYDIISQSNNKIILEGPESPVSKVKIIKEISITESGVVEFSVMVTGIGEESVQWDIWMNSRMDGFDRAYVPIKKGTSPEFVIQENPAVENTPYKIIDGYFTFLPSIPKKKNQTQEVHIHPEYGIIAGVRNGHVLMTKFDVIDTNSTSPGHRQVELYNTIDKTGNDTLLELEIHGAYNQICKNDTITMTIKWKINKAPKTEKEIIQFINKSDEKF